MDSLLPVLGFDPILICQVPIIFKSLLQKRVKHHSWQYNFGTYDTIRQVNISKSVVYLLMFSLHISQSYFRFASLVISRFGIFCKANILKIRTIFIIYCLHCSYMMLYDIFVYFGSSKIII